MTKSIAEQVAGLEIGDWVEARFDRSDMMPEPIIGKLHLSNGALVIDLNSSICFEVRQADGEMGYLLTSITRVPRPIPSEPEVGSFALLDNGDVARSTSDLRYQWLSTNEDMQGWHDIYPHIVKLYTPSGELVEGFEYAKNEGDGYFKKGKK